MAYTFLMSDYLDCFTEALHQIVQEIGFSDAAIDDTVNADLNVEIVASVGITGNLKGFMLIRSDIVSARNFIDKMLENMGMPNDEDGEFGQFHKEAIGEIVNQVSGRSTMMLAERKIDCNITPPTILSGANIYIDLRSCESSISRGIRGSFGFLNLLVGIKNADLLN